MTYARTPEEKLLGRLILDIKEGDLHRAMQAIHGYRLDALSAELHWADTVLEDYIRCWPHQGDEQICPPMPPFENYPRAMERYNEWMSTR